MNEKEIAELRRRLRPEKNNITHLRGCYVNEKRELVTQFDQPLSLLPQEEAEELLSLLRRTLTGTLGRQLLDLSFTTQQVVDSPEHRLLMALRQGEEPAVQQLFETVAQTLAMEGSYLILLAWDTYDVPYRSRDGQALEDASNEVFSYLLCAICPLKEQRPALRYLPVEQAFRNLRADGLVAAPAAGFLFPAFDDRAANLYGSLYYARDPAQPHPELVERLFGQQPPLPAPQQQEAFQQVLEDALGADCSYGVVQTVHEQLRGIIEEHKASKREDPLTISPQAVQGVLAQCGVPQPRLEAFQHQCEQRFGEDPALLPGNLVDAKRFEVRTPDVVIRVNPDCSGLVETRVIDGCRYILIRANEQVEVNGVQIHIE